MGIEWCAAEVVLEHSSGVYLDFIENVILRKECISNISTNSITLSLS